MVESGLFMMVDSDICDGGLEVVCNGGLEAVCDGRLEVACDGRLEVVCDSVLEVVCNGGLEVYHSRPEVVRDGGREAVNAQAEYL